MDAFLRVFKGVGDSVGAAARVSSSPGSSRPTSSSPPASGQASGPQPQMTRQAVQVVVDVSRIPAVPRLSSDDITRAVQNMRSRDVERILDLCFQTQFAVQAILVASIGNREATNAAIPLHRYIANAILTVVRTYLRKKWDVFASSKVSDAEGILSALFQQIEVWSQGDFRVTDPRPRLKVFTSFFCSAMQHTRAKSRFWSSSETKAKATALINECESMIQQRWYHYMMTYLGLCQQVYLRRTPVPFQLAYDRLLPFQQALVCSLLFIAAEYDSTNFPRCFARTAGGALAFAQEMKMSDRLLQPCHEPNPPTISSQSQPTVIAGTVIDNMVGGEIIRLGGLSVTDILSLPELKKIVTPDQEQELKQYRVIEFIDKKTLGPEQEALKTAILDLEAKQRQQWEEISQPFLASCTTFDDCLAFGVATILNRVIAPFSAGLFFDPDGSTSAIQLTDAGVRLFVNINSKGLWTENGQEGITPKDAAVDEYQKAYIVGLCRLSTAQYLCAQVNGIPGYVAYWHRNTSNQFNCSVQQMWVTYDGGRPHTQLPSSTDMLTLVANWNPTLATALMEDPDIVGFVALQTTPGNDLTQVISDVLDRRPQRRSRVPPSTPRPSALLAPPPTPRDDQTPRAPPPTPMGMSSEMYPTDVKSQRSSPSFTMVDAGGATDSVPTPAPSSSEEAKRRAERAAEIRRQMGEGWLNDISYINSDVVDTRIQPPQRTNLFPSYEVSVPPPRQQQNHYPTDVKSQRSSPSVTNVDAGGQSGNPYDACGQRQGGLNESCRTQLCAANVVDHAAWKAYALKNHPDKKTHTAESRQAFANISGCWDTYHREAPTGTLSCTNLSAEQKTTPTTTANRAPVMVQYGTRYQQLTVDENLTNFSLESLVRSLVKAFGIPSDAKIHIFGPDDKEILTVKKFASLLYVAHNMKHDTLQLKMAVEGMEQKQEKKSVMTTVRYETAKPHTIVLQTVLPPSYLNTLLSELVQHFGITLQPGEVASLSVLGGGITIRSTSDLETAVRSASAKYKTLELFLYIDAPLTKSGGDTTTPYRSWEIVSPTPPDAPVFHGADGSTRMGGGGGGGGGKDDFKYFTRAFQKKYGSKPVTRKRKLFILRKMKMYQLWNDFNHLVPENWENRKESPRFSKDREAIYDRIKNSTAWTKI